MLNKIFINNIMILSYNPLTKSFLMENNDYKKYNKKINILIKCNECKNYFERKIFQKSFLKKYYLCQSCNKKGERNPFYNKTHSKISKNKMSKTTSKMYKGNKNPFYGKKHSEETKKKISEKLKIRFSFFDNPFLGKKHNKETIEKIIEKNKKFRLSLSDEEKSEISKKISKKQKEFKDKNPKYYKEIKRKAAIESNKQQSKYKINKIEKIVFELLKEYNFEYSIILNNFQFDFGNKEKRILLEVHGDYWHGNPKLYEKENLNNIQKEKQKKDLLKKEFCLKHNFKLFVIWETDINNKNFEVIEKIIKEII